MVCESLPDLDWTIKLAREAGDIVRNAFYADKKVNFKLSSSDLVTETDVAVEKFLVSAIKEKYPTHKFLCEESSKKDSRLTDCPTWVIDPVDGTNNFVHTLPFVAVSIGFTVDKKPQLGVIYTPIMDEVFYATQGQGSWMISGSDPTPRRIHVAVERPLAHCLVTMGFGASVIKKMRENPSSMSPDEQAKCKEMQAVVQKNAFRLAEACRDIRRLGSCATEMAFVACGRLDASCEIGPKEWDLAAGVIIVEEAGGCVSDYDGNVPVDIGNREAITASSHKLCKTIADILESQSFDYRDLEE